MVDLKTSQGTLGQPQGIPEHPRASQGIPGHPRASPGISGRAIRTDKCSADRRRNERRSSTDNRIRSRNLTGAYNRVGRGPDKGKPWAEMTV